MRNELCVTVCAKAQKSNQIEFFPLFGNEHDKWYFDTCANLRINATRLT